MTWNEALVSEDVRHLPSVQPIEIFYKYDGPILFTANLGFGNLLFSKIDELETGDLFVAAPAEPEAVAAMARGTLSVLGALGDGSCHIVELAANKSVRRLWATSIWEIDPDLLPEPRKGIDFTVDSVPDSLEELNAMISVRFTGPRLGRHVVPFHILRKNLDNFYAAAKKILAPNALAENGLDAFEFLMTEPKFGSLVFSIFDAEINEARLGKRFGAEAPQASALLSEISEKREAFFEGLEELVLRANKEVIPDDSAIRWKGILDDLITILPDHDSEITKLEISGKFDGRRRRISIDNTSAARLRDAQKKLRTEEKDLVGSIEIINKPSNTFVLSSGGREVTCVLKRQSFIDLLSDINFRNGAQVRVRGKVERRPLRDLMIAEGTPTILAPPEPVQDIFG